MNCNCKWVESALAIIIIVFAFIDKSYSQWIIVIAAALLLIHSWTCKSCGVCDMHKGDKMKDMKNMGDMKSKKKKK